MINRGDNLSIKTKTLLSALLFLTLSACAQNIESTEETIETCSQESQYVFGWQFIAERCDFLPRGGTSRGTYDNDSVHDALETLGNSRGPQALC